MRVEPDGPPSRWISRHGRWAVCLDDHDGMPAYESDHGKLHVMENLIAGPGGGGVRDAGSFLAVDDATTFLPTSYMMAAIRSALVGDHELVCLHDDPDAMWVWRPLLHRLTERGLTRLGSQQELGWRWGLAEAKQHALDHESDMMELLLSCSRGGWDTEETISLMRWAIDEYRPQTMDFALANDKARAVLLEHLCGQQRLDLLAWGHFYVRGTINRLYKVEPGNGCSAVHPDTRQQLVSFCIHPERWMPDDDVALALKMMIESGRPGEQEMIEGARPRLVSGRTRGSRSERYAGAAERDLLPPPLLAA